MSSKASGEAGTTTLLVCTDTTSCVSTTTSTVGTSACVSDIYWNLFSSHILGIPLIPVPLRIVWMFLAWLHKAAPLRVTPWQTHWMVRWTTPPVRKSHKLVDAANVLILFKQLWYVCDLAGRPVLWGRASINFHSSLPALDNLFKLSSNNKDSFNISGLLALAHASWSLQMPGQPFEMHTKWVVLGCPHSSYDAAS